MTFFISKCHFGQDMISFGTEMSCFELAIRSFGLALFLFWHSCTAVLKVPEFILPACTILHHDNRSNRLRLQKQSTQQRSEERWPVRRYQNHLICMSRHNSMNWVCSMRHNRICRKSMNWVCSMRHNRICRNSKNCHGRNKTFILIY